MTAMQTSASTMPIATTASPLNQAKRLVTGSSCRIAKSAITTSVSSDVRAEATCGAPGRLVRSSARGSTPARPSAKK